MNKFLFKDAKVGDNFLVIETNKDVWKTKIVDGLFVKDGD